MLHQKASKSPISLLTSIQRLVYTHMLKSHTPVSVPPRCTRGAHTHAMANQKPVMKKKGCVRGVMYSKELLSGDPPLNPKVATVMQLLSARGCCYQGNEAWSTLSSSGSSGLFEYQVGGQWYIRREEHTLVK